MMATGRRAASIRMSGDPRAIKHTSEFTKGGLVKGGLAIWHVFNFHVQMEPNVFHLHKGNA